MSFPADLAAGDSLRLICVPCVTSEEFQQTFQRSSDQLRSRCLKAAVSEHADESLVLAHVYARSPDLAIQIQQRMSSTREPMYVQLIDKNVKVPLICPPLAFGEELVQKNIPESLTSALSEARAETKVRSDEIKGYAEAMKNYAFRVWKISNWSETRGSISSLHRVTFRWRTPPTTLRSREEEINKPKHPGRLWGERVHDKGGRGGGRDDGDLTEQSHLEPHEGREKNPLCDGRDGPRGSASLVVQQRARQDVRPDRRDEVAGTGVWVERGASGGVRSPAAKGEGEEEEEEEEEKWERGKKRKGRQARGSDMFVKGFWNIDSSKSNKEQMREKLEVFFLLAWRML
eukprot:759272-Hanusia_phi.AAC.2